ncbi:MAG TPA: glycohydrolase toxin TNT-related protein [Pseudonocardiaceae bacterium]
MSENQPFTPEEQNQQLQRIAQLLTLRLPPGWQQLQVVFRTVGRYHESGGFLQDITGRQQAWNLPDELLIELSILRHRMYRPGRGTWVGAVFTLDYPNRYTIRYTWDEQPPWATQLGDLFFAQELLFYPRDEEHTPDWLRERAARAPQEHVEEERRIIAAQPVRMPVLVPGWEPVLVQLLGGATTTSPAESSAEPASAGTESDAGTQPGPEAGAEAESGEPPIRRARLFDAMVDDRPQVDRPAVPDEERERLLAYLEQAPIVLGGRGFDVDLIDGERPARVPLTYHTDGEWVWPGAAAYYLREHGVPPEPGLVEHARRRGFRPPEQVDEYARQVALAVVTGAPIPPPPAPAEQPAPAPAAPSAEPTEDERRQLDALRRRLDEHGVYPEEYGLLETREEAYCLTRQGDGWQVAWWERGQARDPLAFVKLWDACAYLLGRLLIAPPRPHDYRPPTAPTPEGGATTQPTPAQDGAAPAEQQATAPAEQSQESGQPPAPARPKATVPPGIRPIPHPSVSPITPLPDEPPLSLFRERRLVELPAGTEVDRFGAPTGNLTYAAGTAFANRSLPPDWANRPYHVYRVERPLQAVAGFAVPWFEQPGGGVGYLLPRSIQELLDEGSLVEIPEATTEPPDPRLS